MQATATATRAALTPTIKIAGQPLSDGLAAALSGLEVRQSIHASGTVTLRFEDPWYQLLDSAPFDLGAAIVVKLPPVDGGAVDVFEGKIVGLGCEEEQGRVPQLVIEARDVRHALATSATFGAYLAGASDVVKKIAQRHGLTAAIVGTPVADDYILQAGTDHAMLTELARRSGYEWFVQGTKLHFRPRPAPSSGPQLSRADGTLLRFSARYTGVDTPASVVVHGWDPGQAVAHQGNASSVTSGGALPLGTDAKLAVDQYSKAKSAFGKALAVGDVATRDATEAGSVAAALARELVGEGLHAEGLAPCTPALKAGGYVSITGLGTTLSGSYYVTEVTHVFGAEQELQTRFVCGGHHVEPAPWSPTGGAGDAWSRQGPVVGVVSNINDTENLGRVKVKLPSLGDIESEWARVVSPGAGKERGLDFRPEMNDEVLVVFERGDPRFPLVLGGLWNGKSAVPRTDLVADGKVKSRVVVSRLGHTLEFGDGASDSESHVTVKLAKGTQLKLSEADGALLDVVKGDIVMKTKNGSITLTEQGDLTIDVKGAVTIKSMKAAKVDTKDAFAVKAATGATIDGGLKFEAKGAQGKVEGSGMLVLKGGMVKVN